ncbi:hypothetical protein KIN20_033955 [Parelaphostrongylus tenuis]|uniref:Uncharacterized protein n=1 Tax=Parelaphostrongylus tenuis TaxID=148309 RepID=A0AAD5WJC1_PARTN|nr:hypothetical protein KIN20_033955 [Parelaphostrongylus tenuis]
MLVVSKRFFLSKQCSDSLMRWESDGDRCLANTVDDPSAPNANRSTSALFSWQRVVLHCLEAKGLDDGGDVEFLDYNGSDADIDGLTGLQNVPINRPTAPRK